MYLRWHDCVRWHVTDMTVKSGIPQAFCYADYSIISSQDMTLSSELDFADEGDADGGKAGEDGDDEGEYFQLCLLRYVII